MIRFIKNLRQGNKITFWKKCKKLVGLRFALILSLIVLVSIAGVPISLYPSAHAQDSTWLEDFRQSETFEEFLQLRRIREDQQRERARAERELVEGLEAEMRYAWNSSDQWRQAEFARLASGISGPPFIGLRYSANAYGATYKVPYGTYHGDNLVGLEEVRMTRPGFTEPHPRARNITRGRKGMRQIGSGWSFEPGGMLKETYNVTNVVHMTGTQQTRCTVANRFQYTSGDRAMEFLSKGLEQTCDFTINSLAGAGDCASQAATFCDATRGTQFWSTNGQVLLDATSRNVPVLTFPDGSNETLRSQGSEAYVPFNEGLLDSDGFNSNSISIRKLTFTDVAKDANGNITAYSYDNRGRLISITDPRGRVTQFERDNAGHVSAIVVPGPGGGTLTWRMTWGTFSWNPAQVFPDIVCLSNFDQPTPCTNNLSFTTLASFMVPDGRSYTFTYGPWGRLETVATPEGAIQDFDYGSAGTPTFSAGRRGFVPNHTSSLDQRRLTAITVYPQGSSGPAHPTTIAHDTTEVLPTQSGCTALDWIKTTYPSGNFMREALCDTGQERRTFAQESWQGNSLLQGIYYGNTGNLGDSSTLVGEFYTEGEVAGPVSDPIPLDVRATKVIYKRAGVISSETFTYQSSDIPANPKCTGCTTFRTTGNVTNKRVFDGGGNLLSRTTTSYFHSGRPSYIARNLLRLPASVTLKDSGPIIIRTDYNYDEFPLIASGAPNLDTTIEARGNVTKVTSYKDAFNGLGPVSSTTRYFDTGNVRQKTDPTSNTTTMTYDFGVCSASHRILVATVSSPAIVVNGSSLNLVTTTATDCFTGATLRITDPNNQSTYTQYDNLGRAVEIAGPGDTLNPIPGLIRDQNPPLNVTGSPWQGPTSWIEYRDLGVINQQRTVTHTKDGSADGRYVKTFVDGLGRTIQTRSEIDPGTSGGNAENVATTEYDNMGRVSKVYVPIFSGTRDSYGAPLPGALAMITTYDALGRMTSVQQPGLPAVTTTYDGSGLNLLATSRDGNGNRTMTFTDMLGRVVQVAREVARAGDPLCSDPVLGSWCVTTMSYDAAGRVLQTTDPAFNHITFVYDGLGRKTEMTDPDMGRWLYEYDDNGNLKKQIDAKGQVVFLYYDALNRIKRKDLPPNDSVNAGPEDTTYFYDGEGPVP